MQFPVVNIKKSYLFALLALSLWAPIPWLYLSPPAFLAGQPLAIYAVTLFLGGISSAAVALLFSLKRRMSPGAARVYSLLFLLAGIGAYQFSGLAPSWDCFGKRIQAAVGNAAGQNCTTTCTNNKKKPCSGWSTCWDKFVSCNSAGTDQDGRPCRGCCFSCNVVCVTPPPPSGNPPSITSSLTCEQLGDNGWCIGNETLDLTASDPQGYTLTISGDIGGTPFTCPQGNSCNLPLPDGNGIINYTVTAAQSGESTSGSTTWMRDAAPPAINGTLSGTAGSNGWYVASVTYNGSASDSISGLAGFTCALDGSPLGSCTAITITDEGAHTLGFTAEDQAGNTQSISQSVSIDLQNPNLTSSIGGTLGSNNWYTAASLNASASDPAPGSGLSALEYDLDNSGWIAFPNSGAIALPEGIHTVDIRALDLAGRMVSATKSFQLDSFAPNVNLNPAGTLGSNNWYTTNLTLTASAGDDTSGLDLFEYSLNNSAWTTYTAPLTLNDGTYSLSFWAQDRAGLVAQVDRTYKVDTRAPQIAGSLSGVPGTNGWYVSNVTLTASAADPSPGSGVDALTYTLNGSAPTPYTQALILPNGKHVIQLDARDTAGLTSSMTQTVNVDTTPPTLNIQTALPNWIKDSITLNGTSSDSESGLTKVEISTDGVTWQSLSGTTSWSYTWNTTDSSNGMRPLRVRAIDNGGLITEQILNAGVDNSAPKISLPDSWYQWDTVPLDIWDNHSGLSETRIEISDPEGRWQTRKIDLDVNDFPLNFKWDRRFGDGTVAPLGTYDVKVIAFDNLGNMARKTATIKILLGILPAGPTSTPQPYVRAEITLAPAITSTPVSSPTASPPAIVSAFGATPAVSPQKTPTPATTPTPRAVPTQTGVLGWLESLFVPNTAEERVTEIGAAETSAQSNSTWAAALAAMTAAATAYALKEKSKRETQDGEARAKRKAQKMAKLEAQWAQERMWEQARLEQQAKEERERGMRLYRAGERGENLPVSQPARSRLETEDAAWLDKKIQAKNQPQPKENLQAGLAAYYAAMRQGEQEASTNWWEKTKSFVKDKIVQPVNTYFFQPIFKPAVEMTKETITDTISWANERIYQPFIKPRIDTDIKNLSIAAALLNEHVVHPVITTLNEKVYQPYIKPRIERDIENLSIAATLLNEHVVQPVITTLNEKVYQPHIKPRIDKDIENLSIAAAWLNEHVIQPVITTLDEKVYQPWIKPLLDKVIEPIAEFTSLVDRKIYQPIFQPVVSDINKYIYQPLANKAENAWDKYGEWVHGALDTAGFIPGFGEIADGLNGLIYLGEGRYIEAAISAAAMIPILGDLGKAGKWTFKIGKEVLEEIAEKIVKETAEEVAEKIVKESLEEAVEKTLKETGEELADKIAKESLEETAEKVLKETGEELAEKATKEVVETAPKKVADEVATKVAKDIPAAALVPSIKKASTTAAEEIVEETLEQASEEAAQRVIKEVVEGKVTKLPTDIANGLTDTNARELAEKMSEELGGKRVWVSAKTGSVYVSSPPAEGFILAEQLSKLDLTKTDEVEKILGRIAELTSRGSGNHVVLGPFGNRGDFIQNALDTNGVFWDVGDELWEELAKTGVDMFRANDQFLRLHISKGIDRFDVIHTDVDKVINDFNISAPKDWMDIKYTEKDVLDLASMSDIPYRLIENSWIRADLIK